MGLSCWREKEATDPKPAFCIIFLKWIWSKSVCVGGQVTFYWETGA